MKTTQVLAATFAVLVGFTLSGCGGGTNSALNPQFQPQVANQPDNFQFQSTGVTGVTQTLTYTWQNSGTSASIDQATTVTTGQAVLALRDNNGIQVYSADLMNNGTFSAATGQTGNWTVVLTLTNYGGTLNFRVQKK